MVKSSRVEQVVLSWSGGKDSSLALAALLADRSYEVVALVTGVTEDRCVAGHRVPYRLIVAQADSLRVPLVEMPLPRSPSNATYESAFAETIARVRGRWPHVSAIAFGDLFLEDVREYRERLSRSVAIGALFPMWGRDTVALARDFISSGFRATLVCVDTTQLSASFVGRAFDERLLAELPSSVDPCGERGEFHTFVHDGPMFEAPIAVRDAGVTTDDERFVYCDLG